MTIVFNKFQVNSPTSSAITSVHEGQFDTNPLSVKTKDKSKKTKVY